MTADERRARILRAALEEFAGKGVAGARVHDIARSAGVNVRTIYTHFENKEGLVQEVTREVFRRGGERAGRSGGPVTPASLLEEFLDRCAIEAEWVRLLGWEEFEKGAGTSWRGDITARVYLLRRCQDAGLVDPDLDPELLCVSLIALAMAPLAFPTLIQAATGTDSGSARFRAGFREHLLRLAKPALSRTA
ncbi:TetR family transcriptional regulator [Nonomuraea sp. NPDC050310]|uniref:TetR/AcrR family transcriptional regulator n=1 Tax=Nonomuraea sp. NPDC050310 TaxID=3154935 RepID=UPI0034081176